MADNKDRILDLMRRGIISEDEAVELLEKGEYSITDETSEAAADKIHFNFDFRDGKKKMDYTGAEGYTEHDVDFADAMKYTFGSLFEKGREVFKGVAKSVDDNIDFGNGFPKVKSVSKEVEKDIDGEFNTIAVDIKGGKLSVKPGQNTHLKAKYEIYGAIENNDVDAYLEDKTKAEVNDGVLTVSSTGRIKADMELYLPEKTYEKVALNILHGETKVEKLTATELEVSQLNGDIEISQATSDKLVVSLKNGEIKVVDGKTKDMAVDSINGNVRVTNDFEIANLNLVNGNVLVTESSDTARQLNVKNVNGDIKVSIPETLGLVGHIRTIFGGYKTRLKLDNPFEAGRNGAAVVRTCENSLTFELETKSGTIWLKDIDK